MRAGQSTCQQVPRWIRTAQTRGWVVWQVCLLSQCRCTPILNVLMSRSAIKGSPLGSVFWERRHPPLLPHPSCADPLPPTPAPGSVRICYSPLHFTLFDLEFWSLLLSDVFFFFSSFFLTWLCFILTALIRAVSRWCALCKLGTVALLALTLPLITCNITQTEWANNHLKLFLFTLKMCLFYIWFMLFYVMFV